jgi:hypothetical protein
MCKAIIPFILLTLLCSCTRTSSESTLMHRKKELHKLDRFNYDGIHPQNRVRKPLPTIKSLEPHLGLDNDLKFKVSQKFRNQTSDSWDIPKTLESDEENIFSIKPRKTDSTIKIELKKEN